MMALSPSILSRKNSWSVGREGSISNPFRCLGIAEKKHKITEYNQFSVNGHPCEKNNSLKRTPQTVLVDPQSSLTPYKADTSLRRILTGMSVPTASVLKTIYCNICNVIIFSILKFTLTDGM